MLAYLGLRRGSVTLGAELDADAPAVDESLLPIAPCEVIGV